MDIKAAFIKLHEANQYTLSKLLDNPKYQNDDVLWSCVSWLMNAQASVNKLIESTEGVKHDS